MKVVICVANKPCFRAFLCRPCLGEFGTSGLQRVLPVGFDFAARYSPLLGLSDFMQHLNH